jgi:hypothetical protein
MAKSEAETASMAAITAIIDNLRNISLFSRLLATL